MAPKISVIDKDSNVLGNIEAKVGQHTHAGQIVRTSAKSVWIKSRRSGQIIMRRAYDGIPSLVLHRLSKVDRAAAGLGK